MLDEARLAEVFNAVLPHLNERQRRVLVGAHARAAGWGGIAQVAAASGMSRTTVQQSLRELDKPPPAEGPGRSRRPGGGRKRAEEKDPELLGALDALVDPDARGDPESPLRWTSKSTRELARTLSDQGHAVSHRLVGELLRDLHYSLQGNAKEDEGKQHPDRDAQFQYLNEQVKASLAAGQPVVSVDTKKKELVGNFKNKGGEWQPKGRPRRVNVHDFPGDALGKAIPYGILDLGQGTGWVNVGTDHDTASFAVESLRRWWQVVGQSIYPEAGRLLISADCGGGNGHKLRLWKWELAQLASETGLAITVCHFPPGTSKWNRIEHRLWSAISMNWRGRPLVSHEVIVELIGATKTGNGERVRSELDSNSYPTGVRISDSAFRRLDAVLERHDFHGDWNYTIKPGLQTSP